MAEASEQKPGDRGPAPSSLRIGDRRRFNKPPKFKRTPERLKQCRTAAIKHGRRALLATPVEIASALIRRGERALGMSKEAAARDALTFEIAGKVVTGDMDAMVPVQHALLANNIGIVLDLQERILTDGPVVTKTVIDSEGNAYENDFPHAGLDPMMKLVDRLGATAEQQQWTPKSRTEGNRDKALTQLIEDRKALFGTVPALPAIPTETVK